MQEVHDELLDELKYYEALTEYIIEDAIAKYDGECELEDLKLPPTPLSSQGYGKKLLKEYVKKLNNQEALSSAKGGAEGWEKEDILEVIAWARYFNGKLRFGIERLKDKTEH